MSRTLQQNPRVEAAPLNDEGILFDPTTSKFFQLNRTSAFIWERLSKPTTAETLAEEICRSFGNVGLADALKDVQTTLDEMLSMELVVTKDGG